ncbi:MAG: YciI family protein [Acidimicrobiales bacterium]
MRFMMLIYPNVSENNYMPTAQAVSEMGKYNDELQKAGVLLALDGLHPTSKGARVSGANGKVSVTDGPFAEVKEVIGGYWVIDVSSKEEAIEWAKRCPAVQGPANAPNYEGHVPVIEVRQVFEFEDFPEEVRDAASNPTS